MTGRVDAVVVLARGQSRRMGSPKGLLPVPGASGESFAARIGRSYAALGLGGVLVCPYDLVGPYTAALAGIGRIAVVGGAGGGETARTLDLGWSALGPDVTHLWAQPVDLPLVQTATLAVLQAESGSHPELVVRPACGGRSGHPVILPTAVLARLRGQGDWAAAPVRDVLDRGRERGLVASPRIIDVSDVGVIRDFDRPADLV